MNIIGDNISFLREQKGWTQDQLAAKCNLVGFNISRGTLAKIESKVRRVIDIEIKMLAVALQVEVSELFDDRG